MIWRGADGYKQLQPGMRILDNCSLTLFFETVASLSAWASLYNAKKYVLWRPHIDEIPFLWTFPQERIWLKTSSVFIKDKLIIRELIKKERGQIVDLRTDWDDFLVEDFLKWNHGQAPPLNFLCGIGIVGAEWLNYNPYYIEDSQRYWRTNIPSWLGIQSDRLGENKLIERLYYFGWV